MMKHKTFKASVRPLLRGTLTLAAITLAQGSAWAEASEEQLKQTKLYGDVSIAEDSPDSWGPWSHFEPPAAGPASTLRLPKAGGDLYRPLPQPQPPAALGCVAGGLCGFGVTSQQYLVDGVYSPRTFFPSLLTGDVTQVDDSFWPKAIKLTAATFDPSVSVFMSDFGELMRSPKLFVGATSILVSYSAKAEQAESGQNIYIEARVDRSALETLDTVQAQAGVWVRAMSYLYGKDENGKRIKLRTEIMDSDVVLGRATPAADMAALRANQATATYLGGRFVDGVYAVRLDVQFGPGTWRGSWSGGRDGLVYVESLSDQGPKFIDGRVGFSASGVIDGVNIRSNTVSTGDAGATVSGSVRGAFFGSGAAAAGGVVDIVKTNPRAPVVNVGVDEGGTVGYTNGRYLSPFLAIKSDGQTVKPN